MTRKRNKYDEDDYNIEIQEMEEDIDQCIVIHEGRKIDKTIQGLEKELDDDTRIRIQAIEQQERLEDVYYGLREFSRTKHPNYLFYADMVNFFNYFNENGYYNE